MLGVLTHRIEKWLGAPSWFAWSISICSLQREPLAPVVVKHHRRRLASALDPLVVNRRRFRATVSPVMIHDELAANGSDEPIEQPVGVVGILTKRDRVCSRAVPKDEKAGEPVYGAEHRP